MGGKKRQTGPSTIPEEMESRNREYGMPQPTKWNGKNARSWIELYESVTTKLGWTDDSKASLFSLYLGEHDSWFHLLNSQQKESWENVKSCFIAEFGLSAHERDSIRREFKSRKQISSENVNDFIADVRRLGRTIEKSDDDICEAVIDGFLPVFRNAVRQRNAATLTEIIAIARETESDLRETRTDNLTEIREIKREINQTISDFKTEMRSDINEVLSGLSSKLDNLEINAVRGARPGDNSKTNVAGRDSTFYQHVPEYYQSAPVHGALPPQYMTNPTNLNRQHGHAGPTQQGQTAPTKCHQNLCTSCGEYYPAFEFRVHRLQCQAKQHSCSRCLKKGHFEQFCMSTPASHYPENVNSFNSFRQY